MDYRTLGSDQLVGIAQQRLATIEQEHAQRTSILAFLRVALAHARGLRERWRYARLVREQELQVRELVLAQAHAVAAWEALIRAGAPSPAPTPPPTPAPPPPHGHGKRRRRR